MTSIPSVNLTPWISFGNWLWPSMRRQFFCAPSTSLKTIASAVLFDREPFDRMVRCRTVAAIAERFSAMAQSGNAMTLLIGYGVFIGLLGNAAMNAPLYIYVSRWFDRRRGTALALLGSGSARAGGGG